MKRHIISILVCLFLISLFFDSRPAVAAPYYQGKVITVIVGFAPGGGYDRLTRILTRHLPKFIPGKPTIVVQNMPGAGSIIATNYLYKIAKPDGLTLCTFNRGLVFAQLLKAEGVKFDLTKFAWVGSATIESLILCIRADLPYKTFDDLKKVKEPLSFGSHSPGESDYQQLVLLREFVGLNVKLVVYPSTVDITLANERKEVDGAVGSYDSLKPFIDRGLYRPLLRGRNAAPEIKDLPVDEELAVSKIGKTLLAMRSMPDSIGKPYVAPPGTPEAVMNVLRDAFAKIAKDPVVQEDVRKSMMTMEYVPAKEVQKVLQYLLNQPPDIVKEFSKYVKF